MKTTTLNSLYTQHPARSKFLKLIDLAYRASMRALPMVCSCIALASVTAAETDTPAKTLDFTQVPSQAPRITLSLAISEESISRSQPYLAQRGPEPAPESTALPSSIKEEYKGKDFYGFDLATLADGTRYVTVMNEDKEAKFLSRNETGLWYARVYRIPAEAGTQPVLLREGFQLQGNDVTFPVELQLPGIGATKLKKLRTDLGYSFNGVQNGKPQIYAGRGVNLQVTGSRMSAEGKITLTVTVPMDMTVNRDALTMLRFEPATPGLPERTATGKLGDLLTLGSTRLVVAGLEPDFSKATLAIVAGNLEATLKQQLQLGQQMPPFSQVDLVTRKTVTKEDLLSRTKGAAPVVFVFGELMSPGARMGYGAPSYHAGMGALPLPPGEIAEQLSLEIDPTPIVVFVTRQIGIDFLYGDLRNKTPDYLVLTDFTDPLRTSFRLPQNSPGGWYAPPSLAGGEASLRQLFNLPERTIALAAFGPDGKVAYVRADAGTEFLPALAECRTALHKQR